jgi:hypothetical protein
MVKLLLFLACLCLGISFLFQRLHAKEPIFENGDSLLVNSGEAQYDGKEIVLVGQVVVQHGLGQISAHRLSLLPSSLQDKKSKFGFLKINDDVQLELRGGGKLYCQQAEVDYAKMQGIFLGNVDQPDVTYLNTGEGDDPSQEKRRPIEVKSCQMTLELLRDPKASTSSAKAVVKQIEATQNVRVRYDEDYLLSADHALYKRFSPDESIEQTGFLTLSVGEGKPFCEMTNLNGDRLYAQTIRVDTIKRRLWLDRPQGTLYIRQEKLPPQNFEFRANELTWDDHKETLQLKGQVNLIQNGTVHVLTDREIEIVQTFVNGKRTLRSLQAQENIQISYLDLQKGDTHRIHCPGPLVIDHEHLCMTLRGLTDLAEPVEENRQVYIEDLLGEMYADQVQISYSWEDKQLVPQKIVLEGHVRILNRFDGHPEESGSILHYALSDRVDYLPERQEMILSSLEGNRVLFFDKVNNVQMSATSLKVQRDATTKKNSIRGLGDVRFTFIEKEFEQLKQRFSQKEISNGKDGKGKQ